MGRMMPYPGLSRKTMAEMTPSGAVLKTGDAPSTGGAPSEPQGVPIRPSDSLVPEPAQPRGTGASEAISFSCFSSAQNAAGTATDREATLANTCSGVRAPGITAETTSGASAN